MAGQNHVPGEQHAKPGRASPTGFPSRAAQSPSSSPHQPGLCDPALPLPGSLSHPQQLTFCAHIQAGWQAQICYGGAWQLACSSTPAPEYRGVGYCLGLCFSQLGALPGLRPQATETPALASQQCF